MPAVACASAAPAKASPRSETKSERGGARAGAGCALPKNVRRRCAMFTATKATWAGACTVRLFSEGGGIAGHHITFGRRGERKHALVRTESDSGSPVTCDCDCELLATCCCCLPACLMQLDYQLAAGFRFKRSTKNRFKSFSCVSHKPQLTP